MLSLDYWASCLYVRSQSTMSFHGPVKNLVRHLFTLTVFTDFWLKLLLCSLGLQYEWYGGYDSKREELTVHRVDYFFAGENAFPVLILTPASFVCVFHPCMRELGSGVISPHYTFNCKQEHMKLMCFSTYTARNKTSALTMLCWLPSCCMCMQMSAFSAATAKMSVPIQAGNTFLLLIDQLCCYWKAKLSWRVLLKKLKHEMYMKYL